MSPRPLAPESDEEKPGEPDAAEEGGGGRGVEAAVATGGARRLPRCPPKPVRIDFDRLDQRIVAMPFPARNYTDRWPRAARASST